MNSKAQKCLKSLILTILVTALLIVPANGQGFQAMRLVIGVFKIIGDAIANIPASCLQVSKHIPKPSDQYETVSGDFSVIREERTGGGVTRDTLSGTAALEKWLTIRGNHTIGSVTIEPKVRQPNVTYTIKVNSSKTFVTGKALPGENSDTANLQKRVEDNSKSLEAIDKFDDELSQTFGEKSAIHYLFAGVKQDLIWDVVAEELEKPVVLDDAAITSRFAEALKERVGTVSSDSERLIRLSIINGSKLNTEQIVELEKRIGTPIAHDYDKEALAVLDQHFETVKGLTEAFAADNFLVQQYKDDAILGLRFGGDLKSALSVARRGVIDKELRTAVNRVPAGEGRRELFKLLVPTFYDQRLTDAQISLLVKLAEIDLGASSGKFNECIVITPVGKENVQWTDNQDSKEVAINSLADAQLSTMLKGKRVILDDSHETLNAATAKKLKDSGVTVIRSIDDFMNDPKPAPMKIKLIFASSSSRAAANRLFEGQDFASIVAANQVINRIPASSRVIVQTRQQLVNALQVGPNEQAIVIFHNADVDLDSGINFLQPFYLDEFEDYRAVALSCDTFSDSSLYYRTTGKLDFKVTAQALADTISTARDRPVPIDDFMSSFQANYERRSRLGGLNRSVMLISKVIGASSVMYALYAIVDRLISEKQDQTNRLVARSRQMKRTNRVDRGFVYARWSLLSPEDAQATNFAFPFSRRKIRRLYQRKELDLSQP